MYTYKKETVFVANKLNAYLQLSEPTSLQKNSHIYSLAVPRCFADL